jgi:hypothetical protein
LSTPSTPLASSPSKIQNILGIINLAIKGLSLAPGPVGAIGGIASIFSQMLQNGLLLYQQETGQPFDITKIPLETPIA